MTLDPALEAATAEAIVEGVALRRRKEEGARVHLHLSFPRRSGKALMELVGENFGNVVKLSITPFQAGLMETPKPEGEEVEMVVDGEPAKVRRPRNNRARNGSNPTEEINAGKVDNLADLSLAELEAKAAAESERAAEAEIEGLSGTAQSLIEEAQQTPARPQESALL